ncbi:hypothetical protein E4Q08_14270, partial [Candidatus Accumulibacter phosphatis]|nr:hypothetical protein [Candidatus Accumulibacter contiguus]
MPKISHIEPCDSRDLVARLEANPKILAKVLEMLELVENAEGDLRRADEAERRVIEILRGTGQEILTGWAEQVAEAVTAEVRAAEPVVVHAKKKVLWYTTYGSVMVEEECFLHKETNR